MLKYNSNSNAIEKCVCGTSMQLSKEYEYTRIHVFA